MKKKVAVIYHCFAHYRRAIVEELTKSDDVEYIFIASEKAIDPSIKTMDFADNISFYDAPCKKIGPFIIQSKIHSYLEENAVDGVIILGNMLFLSYWRVCFSFRRQNKPVWMWTQGWIDRNVKGLKTLVRNKFYHLADGLLLYGQRDVDTGKLYGFDADKLHFIGNSLDFPAMTETFNQVRPLDRKKLKKELGLNENNPIVVCSARLTPLCRFDLLIEAVAKITDLEHDITIALIGDGIEKNNLITQAKNLSVDVKFIGACYDELLIAKYHHVADMSVSPGKVGLTAMHSMTYGTPTISHDNFDKQMPEVEAIIDGETGSLFKHDNAESLALEIRRWLHIKERDQNVIDVCRNLIEQRYSPKAQAGYIEGAILKSWP